MRKRPNRSTHNLTFQPTTTNDKSSNPYYNNNNNPYINNDSIDPIDWKNKEFSKQKYEVAKVFNCPVWIDLGQNSIATIVSKTLANGLDSGIPLELSINMSMNCFMGPIILFSISIVLFVLFVSIFCIYSKKKKLNFKEGQRKGFLESLKLPREEERNQQQASNSISNNKFNINNISSKLNRKAKLKGPRSFFAENFQANLPSTDNNRSAGNQEIQNQNVVQPFSQLGNPNLPNHTFVPNNNNNTLTNDVSELSQNYNRNYQTLNNAKIVNFPNNTTKESSSNLMQSEEYIVNNNHSNNNHNSITRPYNNLSNINNVILNGQKMSPNERGLINSAFNQNFHNFGIPTGFPSQLTRVGNQPSSSKSKTSNNTRSGTEIRPKTLIISSNLRPDQIKKNSTSPQYVKKNNFGSQKIPIEKPEIIRSISPSKLNCLDSYNHSVGDQGQHTVANTITI